MTQLIENQPVTQALPSAFDEASRLWFYTSDRKLTAAETAFCRQKLAEFLPAWTAHNLALKAFGEVFFDNILVIAVDETSAGASGCGIDKSVRFVEQIGAAIGVDFFDRMIVGFENAAGEAVFLPFSKLAEEVKSGAFSPETVLFDTTVLTKKAFAEGFRKPVSQSWMARFL